MIVTKNQFLQLLHHFADSSAEDAQSVLSLKDMYPYSQVLHALSARLSKDQGFSTQKKELQSAAVYAADRNVLKEVMTMTEAWPTVTVVNDERQQETPEIIMNRETYTDNESLIRNADKSSLVAAEEDVADELIHDLEKLSELRHHFEELFVDNDTATIKEKPAAVVDAPATEEEETEREETEDEKDEKVKKRPIPPGRKPGRSRAERIIQLARELEASEHNDAGEEEPSDELIKELTSKKKILPEDEKLREQISIINNFIRVQPSITNAKEKQPVIEGDLSTIKSGDFNDNVISETLVQLLLRQGKKEKALEVLKKLIWKFPQKKAYFAAQIEELKK